MDATQKIKLLNRVYRIFDDFAATRKMACKRLCATCCTCNMSLTTLEGLKILAEIDPGTKAAYMAVIHDHVAKPHFKPKLTTNQIARRCMMGQDLPDEEIDPAWGPCPILVEEECPIYTIRPFGCRCMMSKKVCAETGFADMDDFTLSVTNLFNQFIEDLDHNGMTGNLMDILLFLNAPENLAAYQSGKITARATDLIPNRPIPVLMIPPEHHERIQPLLASLSSLKSENDMH